MNRTARFHAVSLMVFVAALAASPVMAQGDPSSSDLAKAAQNPVADLISVPMQLNMNFDTGPEDDLQSILNIQPVVPFSLSKDWNVITRTVIPLISQPDFGVYSERKNGIGDIQFSAFLSPKAPSRGWIWGIGPIAQLDSATDDRLGQGVWGLGPTAVVLRISGSWVVGALVNNVWSASDEDPRDEVNQLLTQPFVNYNFASSPGRYLQFAPIITANWKASGDNSWLVPLGLGIGQITRFGNQPVNLQAHFYYNVIRPDDASRYQVRMQLQFMFPK